MKNRRASSTLSLSLSIAPRHYYYDIFLLAVALATIEK